MKYKLIAMDLDGTLNNDRKAIDPPTRDALLAAQAAGVRLLLASARPLPGLYKERDLLDLTSHHGLLMALATAALADLPPALWILSRRSITPPRAFRFATSTGFSRR